MKELPFVSVVMPVFNEERYIARSLGSILTQDYPTDRMEIIVTDGMSTDRTREIVREIQSRHANVRLIDNPGRIVSTGLNQAVRAACGEIIARMDGHNEFPRDYLRQVVELREQTGADNAGGVLVPVGHNYVSDAVAAACFSPVGIGGAQKGHADADAVRDVDAVHGGCWRRDRLLEVGLFDETMVRNQDDELSFRFRKSGGRIVQSAAIRMNYAVRDSFKKLFMQFAQYGYWKVRVIRKHPRQASVRHFVPAAFVLALVSTAAAAMFWRPGAWACGALLAFYLGVMALAGLVEAFRSGLKLWPAIVVALVAMHIGYAWGSLMGGLRHLTGPLPTDRIFERVTR